ncbi:hypothetical protein CVO77_03595 [Sphingopyxis lindanitolerans]|uniref:Uncharacterized protein n=1 Tax=Sphingopyxis lindanitolerans TaxID=2054227 RepID=A0A2S8B5N6_9SPHN|nr:hypothetical protein [Sphingopyxis lindanitolerans]PQM27667.1 hypothetical protein CVO77_03595 [Sphingopyxis lindanitolerans]
MAPDPHIEIRKDGPFVRVVVLPAGAMPANWHGPSTFSSAPLARMSAKFLATTSGLPIVDQTGGR